MQDTSWRSPFLGVGVLASTLGLYVLFNDQGTLDFRIGTFAGGFFGSMVIALPLFLLWRFALKAGRSQTLGAAFNIFVALAVSIWFLLFVVAKQALPSFIEKSGTSTELADLYAVGWTQENTGTAEIGPWLNYDPPGTRYCRNHDRTIQKLFPPNTKPAPEKAHPFCLPGSALAELK